MSWSSMQGARASKIAVVRAGLAMSVQPSAKAAQLDCAIDICACRHYRTS
jgi:hypothetical protein